MESMGMPPPTPVRAIRDHQVSVSSPAFLRWEYYFALACGPIECFLEDFMARAYPDRPTVTLGDNLRIHIAEDAGGGPGTFPFAFKNVITFSNLLSTLRGACSLSSRRNAENFSRSFRSISSRFSLWQDSTSKRGPSNTRQRFSASS